MSERKTAEAGLREQGQNGARTTSDAGKKTINWKSSAGTCRIRLRPAARQIE